MLTARGVSREALFLPIGWDTEKRIGLLREGTELPEEIVQPKQRSIVTEQELTAEDEARSVGEVLAATKRALDDWCKFQVF